MDVLAGIAPDQRARRLADFFKKLLGLTSRFLDAVRPRNEIC